jgi:DNA-binding MarR family transcriptional regulator/GNAT superfamily N-acetyltransferase
MHADEIGQVRRFNRTVTQRVGALRDRFLATDRPLAEARMLWEIGVEGCEVRALRNRLELDSGHASRLLRALEEDGLVRIQPAPSDRRVRMARLTPKGLAERAVLDERSDDLAASMLDSLDGEQRDRLVGAMRTVERLLTHSAVQLRQVDPNHPDARQCVRAYFAELDRRSDSDLSSDDTLPTDPDELRPPAGHFLVAYLHGEAVGCGGVKHHAGAWSELKRIWVSESARGLGLGRRILNELESLAADRGATRVRLDTNRNLVEAIAMYRSAGYREIPAFNDEPFAHHWFEKKLG